MFKIKLQFPNVTAYIVEVLEDNVNKSRFTLQFDDAYFYEDREYAEEHIKLLRTSPHCAGGSFFLVDADSGEEL